MKKIKIFSLLSILIVSLIYTTNVTAIPNNIILFDGEEPNFETVLGVTINKKEQNNYEVQQTASTIGTKINELKHVNYQVNLLDSIPIKTIEANIIPQTTVIPVGSTIGLKLYTDGVLVVGMSEIENSNNEKVKPYEQTQIQEGDRIVEIDDKIITCTADLVECINSSNGNEVKVKYAREEQYFTSSITPVKTASNEYKLGLWVRDAQARSWDYIFL